MEMKKNLESKKIEVNLKDEENKNLVKQLKELQKNSQAYNSDDKNGDA